MFYNKFVRLHKYGCIFFKEILTIMLVPLGKPFSLDSGPLFTLDSLERVRVRRQISQSTHTWRGACLPVKINRNKKQHMLVNVGSLDRC